MQRPQGLGFSGTKQKQVGGGSASSACSPWSNGSVAWIPSPRNSTALLAPKGAAETSGAAEG